MHELRVLAVVFGCFVALPAFASQVLAEDRFDLAILYCGDSGSEREKDFRDFLTRHFTRATSIGLGDLSEEKAEGYDVVIVDWSEFYNSDLIDYEQRERFREVNRHLPINFARPTILISAAGVDVARSLQLKTNWLCLCLDGPAYKPTLDHRLFHKPLEVNPEFEEIPTREGFARLTIYSELGPTMKAWRVQDEKHKAPGLVSTLYGFADSPDAEVFAQGIAQKGPDTVSLGRHASFFLWGFSAPPAEMTPSGRRLFVNAVCYIKEFDGARPLVRNVEQPREWVLHYAVMARPKSTEQRVKDDQAYRDYWKKHLQRNPQFVPEEWKGRTAEYIEWRVEEGRRREGNFIDDTFPAELVARFGHDPEKYISYYREKLEFLRGINSDSGRYEWLVDEEAKTVGPSNRHVELIERCVAMLERDDRPELARSVLAQYTTADCESPEAWRTWLDDNRDRLFFSDAGGYKFFVGPPRPAAARPAGPRMQLLPAVKTEQGLTTTVTSSNRSAIAPRQIVR